MSYFSLPLIPNNVLKHSKNGTRFLNSIFETTMPFLQISCTLNSQKYSHIYINFNRINSFVETTLLRLNTSLKNWNLWSFALEMRRTDCYESNLSTQQTKRSLIRSSMKLNWYKKSMLLCEPKTKLFGQKLKAWNGSWRSWRMKYVHSPISFIHSLLNTYKRSVSFSNSIMNTNELWIIEKCASR